MTNDKLIEKLLNEIESNNFECTGGPLKNLVQWTQLRELVSAHAITSIQTEQPVELKSLISSAQALLELDKAGALVPIGVCGHARTIIERFIKYNSITAPSTVTSMQGDSELNSKITYAIDTHECFSDGSKERLLEAVKKLLSTNTDGWVSVDDRLPAFDVIVDDETIEYLVRYKHDGSSVWRVGMAERDSDEYYSSNNGFAFGSANNVKVSHWQPLPPINAISQPKG